MRSGAAVSTNDVRALRMAIEDLSESFPGKFTRGAEFLKRLNAVRDEKEFAALQREALLANPLLDFEQLLLVKRKVGEGKGEGQAMGLPQNWQGDCALGGVYENEIAVLSPVKPDGKLTTLFKPGKPVFVGDVDLNFDADKMLFTMKSPVDGRWNIYEIKADGSGLRQVTPDMGKEIDNYDPCYLPDGRIIFSSTACVEGVPCVGGGTAVANLMRMEADGTNLRQLCFDQEHDWCPTVMNDGRVLYSRWEYTDTPHYFTRLLFRMNPDGTGQAEYYGSNSYWPNSIFYARPIPGHPSKVVGVISGHHGAARMGELIVFDPTRGTKEAGGVVQRIPGYGKPVEPVIKDQLVGASWPKFLHPFPLSEKYFLVSCKPSATSAWGIYLVDIFDNMIPILEAPGYAMLEPVPFRATTRPQIIPDKIKPGAKDATVLMDDVYAGPGLAGVPRGTVKKLRVFEYHFAYRGMGGHINIGIDGPWDVHRILGTVPVNADGSAAFKIPANTPVAVQPLDSEGRAVQVMRSWFTAMPGERVSCVGCHESQNKALTTRVSSANQADPVEITPWYGPARGFSFRREVQPVLDRKCAGCHNGEKRKDGKIIPNFTGDFSEVDLSKKKKARAFTFDSAYVALHPYVRRPGPENDYHLPMAFEWHADTSELIQMLKKGHHNVQLSAEDWDRLYTWIDLNVPDHGTWGEHRKIAGDFHELRLATRKQYGNITIDPEEIVNPYTPGTIKYEPPKESEIANRKLQITNPPGWPFDAAEAKNRQSSAGLPGELKFPLSTNVTLELALIPAGDFVMGDANGEADEVPQARVKIAKSFYIGKCEINNAQFALFNPAHESGVVAQFNKDHTRPGEPVDLDRQPVVRVSWNEAMAFCDWISKKTGKKASLPTEAQWEYACRAGTATPMNYGSCETDFGKLANLADSRLVSLCIGNSPKWIPHDDSVNDGAIVTAPCGNYRPNAWGLFDMAGNAAEWTRSSFRAYPYRDDDGRNDVAGRDAKVVRGGSFYDRPQRARSAFRLSYAPQQPVFDVGFRVIVEE